MSSTNIGRRGVLGGAGLVLAAPTVSLAAGKPRVVLTTYHGVITVELEPKRAPLTTANFLRYVAAKKYDGATFYRAARQKGAPKEGTIVASPGKTAQPYPGIPHESTTMTGLRHKAGTISLGPVRARHGEGRLLHLRQRPAVSGRAARRARRQPGFRPPSARWFRA
jgi:peptidyl-prolyl cis-trans isomerase A (cyclophilin A)